MVHQPIINGQGGKYIFVADSPQPANQQSFVQPAMPQNQQGFVQPVMPQNQQSFVQPAMPQNQAINNNQNMARGQHQGRFVPYKTINRFAAPNQANGQNSATGTSNAVVVPQPPPMPRVTNAEAISHMDRNVCAALATLGEQLVNMSGLLSAWLEKQDEQRQQIQKIQFEPLTPVKPVEYGPKEAPKED